VGDSVTGRAETIRRVLAEPRLRRVESAFFAFGAAEYGVWVAILVYAYERGGTTLAGVIAVVQLLPAAVVAPLATRVAERLSRGAALHLGYGTLAASLTVTAAVLLLKAPAPIVYAGAVVAASAVTLIRPGQSALLPDLVSEPADLTAANAITGWVESSSLLIGPAAAGVMIGLDGPGAAVALFAVGTVLATILIAPLGGADGTSESESESRADDQPADDPGTVLQQLRHDRTVTLLLALLGVQFVALGALDVLEIVLAVHVLSLGPSGAGYLAAAFGAGSVLGAAGTIGLVGRNRLANSVLGGAAAIGTAFVALGIWPTVAGAFALLCGVGAAHAALDVAARTMLHRVIPDTLRRHVFGLQEGLAMLGLAIGSIAVPPLVHAGGAEAALCTIGGLLIVVAALTAPRLAAVERAAPAPVAELAALRRSPLFAMLAAPVLEDLARALAPLSVSAGQTVVREGDTGDLFYLIADGRFDVSIGGRHIRTEGPGEGFGEIALLRDGIRTATVTAGEAGRLFVLPREPFLAAVTGSPAAQRAAEELVTDRLAREQSSA
jgi:MFS family permease